MELDLPTRYDPASVEKRWYAFWEERGYFKADPDPRRKPYTIVIPPPNVTGVLTLGHVLNNTIQDVLVRWRRMQGYNALWQPGTDHAGIATQSVVERLLDAEGTSRHALGREKFVERVWQVKEKHVRIINEQLRRLGASLDWRRERFTMDEGLSRAVLDVFIRLYQKGLVYRDKFMINWCPFHRTALSNDEVEHETVQGGLWWIRYPYKESACGTGAPACATTAEGGCATSLPAGITVATTRPETMLGDTAVAVNPNDPRYRDVVGKTVILPLMNREIPVIADEYVSMEFGTGALKITPAHDPNDFAIGRKHGLAAPCVIAPDGTMSDEAGAYRGLDRFECRDRVVADLKKLGLLEKFEPYEHEVGHCYRCDTIVEPYISLQWFVRMKPLADRARKVAEDESIESMKSIRFWPPRWKTMYYHWIDTEPRCQAPSKDVCGCPRGTCGGLRHFGLADRSALGGEAAKRVMGQMGRMGRGVNETSAAAGGVVNAVSSSVEDKDEAVQSIVAIVGHLLAGSYGRHSIAILIIPEGGGRRKGILWRGAGGRGHRTRSSFSCGKSQPQGRTSGHGRSACRC